ncbi:hypothetical protein ACQP3D_29280, partial [Escherichia coli]
AGACFLLPCPLDKLLAQGVVKIEGGPYCLTRSRLKAGLPTSKDLILRKNPSHVYPDFWILVNSRCSQVENQK